MSAPSEEMVERSAAVMAERFGQHWSTAAWRDAIEGIVEVIAPDIEENIFVNSVAHDGILRPDLCAKLESREYRENYISGLVRGFRRSRDIESTALERGRIEGLTEAARVAESFVVFTEYQNEQMTAHQRLNNSHQITRDKTHRKDAAAIRALIPKPEAGHDK